MWSSIGCDDPLQKDCLSSPWIAHAEELPVLSKVGAVLSKVGAPTLPLDKLVTLEQLMTRPIQTDEPCRLMRMYGLDG